MMPGADLAPTTREAESRVDPRDGIAVGALFVFVIALTIAGFIVHAALGFLALAIAALTVALIIGLR